jgi:hypothetical protein
MKKQIAFILAPAIALALNSCVVVESDGSANNGTDTPHAGSALTATAGMGTVTIRENGQVINTIRTAKPNVEKTQWHKGHSQITVKSRGNHGPATVQLFDSRSGTQLGTVMAFELANGGPTWAKGMAD